MTGYNVYKDRETANKNRLILTTYKVVQSSTGVYASYPDRVIPYTGVTLLGEKEAFFGVNRGRFKPRNFTLNPALHQTVEASCTEDIAFLSTLYSGQPCVVRSGKGPLASLVAINRPKWSVPAAVSDIGHEAVIQEAYALAKASEMQFMTSVAELPETIRMMDPRTVELRKMMRKLRPRRSLRLLGTIADYASSAWLQYRYGIMPVVYEVDTIRHLYASRAQVLEKKDRGVAHEDGGSTEQSWTFRRATALGFYLSGFEQKTSETRWVSSVYTIRQLNMLAKLGLDASSIPLTAWEIVPYSFVVDWFFDIGSWLRAAMPSPHIRIQGMTLSSIFDEKYFCQTKTAGMALVPSVVQPDTAALSRFDMRRRSYRRTLTSYAPTSAITWGLNSLKRELDSASLAYGKIRRSLNIRR